MADILDDVKDLLDIGKGDERILKQILRACENNEIISNYERNYVRKLAESYLSKPVIENANMPVRSKSFLPQTTTISTKPTNNNKFIIIGIISVLVVIAVSFYAMQPNDMPVVTPIDTPVDIPINLSIKTDLSTYQKGDLISISGSATSNSVNLSIMNNNDELIWSDELSVKDNDTYSTLAIAGGDGWDESGTFTITVTDDSESKSASFSFTG